jgi:hypothetical protein
MSPLARRDLEMDLIQRPVNNPTLPIRNSLQDDTTDSNLISKVSTPQHAVAGSNSPSPPEPIESGEYVTRLRQARRTTNGDQAPNLQDNSLANPTSSGKSNFKQYRNTLLLAALTSSLLGFSTWLIYIEFISLKEVPRRLELPPGSSHLSIFCPGLYYSWWPCWSWLPGKQYESLWLPESMEFRTRTSSQCLLPLLFFSDDSIKSTVRSALYI